MRVGIASDHEGFELKEYILKYLRMRDYISVDFGAAKLNPDDDYPDFVIPLAKAVSQGEVDRGIAICGSGIGACIACNKVKDVRAGIIHDVFSAIQGVEDDDMNIICIGAQLVSFSVAIEIVQGFLGSNFSNEPRYKHRLEKISKIEQSAVI